MSAPQSSHLATSRCLSRWSFASLRQQSFIAVVSRAWSPLRRRVCGSEEPASGRTSRKRVCAGGEGIARESPCESDQPPCDLESHLPIGGPAPRPTEVAPDTSDVRVQGNDQAGRRDELPEPEIEAVVSTDHPPHA